MDTRDGYALDYTGTYPDEVLTIPAEHDGLPIKEIVSDAFIGSRMITLELEITDKEENV